MAAPGPPRPPAPPRAARIPAVAGEHVYSGIARVLHDGAAPLLPVPPSAAGRPLRLALVVPHFGFGSGGHHVVFQLARGLEERGHAVSYWLHDPHGEARHGSGGALRAAIREQYAPIEGPAFTGFSEWPGADVVIATGWQTFYPTLALDRCRARAYLVNDHEPEFYPTSIEALFAARTYTLGVPCIVGGGPWLADLLRQRYGVEVAARFPYPVAPEFVPRDVPRREDTIVVYGRNVTPRRAVGLALITLEELKRRRPELRIVLFGDEGAPALNFDHEHHGPITPEALSWVYSEATVGIAYSLTHGSLVPGDMLACGLPAVDLDGFSTAAEHAGTGLVELVPLDPLAAVPAIERLLDDPAERARRSRAGIAYVAERTWDVAVDRVEAGLRSIVQARAGLTAPT